MHMQVCMYKHYNIHRLTVTTSITLCRLLSGSLEVNLCYDRQLQSKSFPFGHIRVARTTSYDSKYMGGCLPLAVELGKGQIPKTP